MKILMLLVWLVGGEPKSEVLFFDTEDLCMAFGDARIEMLKSKHDDLQLLVGECVETELQGA